MNVGRPQLILASTSPRRRELLSGMGLEFLVIAPDVEEKPLPGELPADYVARNARLKAEAILARPESLAHPELIVVAADTIVVLGQQILEKPFDVAHAEAMLGQLSGRTHEVLTGLQVYFQTAAGLRSHAQVVRTSVEFKDLSTKEISAYVASGESMDKAGSYAAQGRGSYLVKALHGSYTNVVGLPMAELLAVLAEPLQLWV